MPVSANTRTALEQAFADPAAAQEVANILSVIFDRLDAIEAAFPPGIHPATKDKNTKHEAEEKHTKGKSHG